MEGSQEQQPENVAPVRPEQHTLPQLAGVAGTGEDVVDADGEGVRVVRARLVVRWLWHGQLLPVHVAGAGWRSHRLWCPVSDVREKIMEI
jgi:hypothetical protein